MTEFERLAEREKPLLIKMRRHLHEHPELSGEETETVRYIGKIPAICGDRKPASAG